MSSFPLREGMKLYFSDLNQISHLPTREIARRIASNKRLRYVVVDQALNVSNSKKRSIYEAIYEYEQIEMLLFGRGVDLEVVGLHLRRMKDVRVVRFHGVSLSNPDPFTSAHLLMPNRNLQRLFLEGGNMGDAASQAVLQSVRLRCCLRRLSFVRAGLTNCGVIAIGHALQHHSMLTEVTLAESRLVIEDEAGAVLARGIETNTSIKRLTLIVKEVLAAGCERVFRALTANATLNDVDVCLGRNGREVSVGAAQLLSENNTLTKFCLTTNNPNVPLIAVALVTNESLETFGLGARLDASDIECVCNAFERNAFVNNLVFQSSRITVEGTRPICRILSNDPNLKSLVLAKCQIDDDTVIALCESAKQSQSLDSLNLIFNNIGNRGAFALADLVSSSPIIKKLSLVNNDNIGDDGFAGIGTALEHNVSLEELELNKGRNITDRGIRALLDGVKVHPMLTKVRFGSLSNRLQKDELDFYLERNKGPKHILHSNVPLSLWPLVLERADECRHVGSRLRAPDMLYHFVKEKCELFHRRPSSRKRKRVY